ncbi:restriction endonuclease subunit S [Rhizobium leguminosarum]
MTSIDTLLTDHLDLWTSAIARKSSAGRGRSKKFSLYGIEKLRALILDLAVRGKLVPQNPEDEPASELLKRIKAEKVRLLKTNNLKEPKTPPELGAAERDFSLPRGWAWSQLAAVGFINPRNIASDTQEASFVPMPMIAAEYRVANQHEPRIWGEIKKGYTHFAEGDVGLAKITPCFENGKSTVFRDLTGGIGSGTTELHVVRPVSVEANYILIFLKSPGFVAAGIPKMTGTAGQKRVPTEFFANSPFPLPPLSEQRRIVAKVDELMALCDRLEAGTYEAIEAHQLLVTELLATLTASRDAQELADNWAWIETHFDTLFVTEDSVDQLKQTILQLAVMGRLVPQDPKDEPASDLLKRIRTNIANYAKTRGNPPLVVEAINTELAPFHLPNSWCWTRLSAVFKVITDGDHQAPPKASEGIAFLTIGNITTNRLDFEGCRFVPGEYFDAIPPYRSPAKGDILYTVVGATYGRPALVDTDRPFCVQRHIAILKPVENMNRRFLFLLLSSQLIYLQAKESITGTAQPTIPLRPLRNFLIPLPPLAEQARIVARIDRLMELCDALKSDLRGCSELLVGLADAFVARAVG